MMLSTTKTVLYYYLRYFNKNGFAYQKSSIQDNNTKDNNLESEDHI